MVTRKGITIIEIMISIVVAMILITALYMIVYWGSGVLTVNNKIMEVNNIMTFIQIEIKNNTAMYFELSSKGVMIPRNNINDLLKMKIKKVIGLKNFIKDIKIESISQEVMKRNFLANQTFDNLYRVKLVIEWVHKGKVNRYATEFLVTSYNLKKITVNQDLSENEIRVELPLSYYPRVTLVMYTTPPPISVETPTSVVSTLTSNKAISTTTVSETTIYSTDLSSTISSTTVSTTTSKTCPVCGQSLVTCSKCGQCLNCTKGQSCPAGGVHPL